MYAEKEPVVDWMEGMMPLHSEARRRTSLLVFCKNHNGLVPHRNAIDIISWERVSGQSDIRKYLHSSRFALGAASSRFDMASP